MRKSVVMYTVLAAIMLMGALSGPPSAQAVTLAPTGIKATVQEEKFVQEAACRRGCSYISSSNRQSNTSGDTAYFQKRYSPSQYQQYPWGNPYRN